MVLKKFFCLVVNAAGCVFPINIDDAESVGDLKDAIKDKGMFQFPANDLELFLAKQDDDEWLSVAEAAALALDEHGHLQGFKPMNAALWIKNPEHFGEDFQAKEEQVHVLVVLPTTSEPALKRRKLEASISLAELWKYSELRLQAFPSVHELVGLLLNRQPEGLFEPDGPHVSCHHLETLLDVFIYNCDKPSDASVEMWQTHYGHLLRLTTSLCRAKRFTVGSGRGHVDRAKSDILPDYVLQSDGLILLRGEENSVLEGIEESVEELTSKMQSVERGALRRSALSGYILGYATSGDRLRVVAIERTNGSCRVTTLVDFKIFDNKALALNVFYNLAFVLHQMSKLAKRPYSCGLEPFVPVRNEARQIMLLDKVVERTIEPTRASKDFARMATVYQTLQEMGAQGSSETHLQTVEKMVETEDGSLVVSLSPIGYLRLPTEDEVGEWLRQMLTALKFWHGRGYCHGDVNWRNIVAVPPANNRSEYWMLIDMDESRQRSEEAVIQWKHPFFRGQTLQFQHDLFQLGQLMNDLSPLPEDMKSLQTVLLSAMDRSGLTADAVLVSLAKHIE